MAKETSAAVRKNFSWSYVAAVVGFVVQVEIGSDPVELERRKASVWFQTVKTRDVIKNLGL